MQLQAVRQPRPLVEGIERQLLDEGESVHKDVVALRPELYTPDLLPSHYRSHVGLADAHYPVFHALPGFVPVKVPLLLTVHPRDDFHVTLLSGRQQFLRTCVLPLNPAYLIQYLPQKVKQASG